MQFVKKMAGSVVLMLGLTGMMSAGMALAQSSAPVDFSGTWMPAQGPGLTQGFPRSDWPFTEKGQQLYDAFTAEFNPIEDDSAFFCVWPGMPMSMAAAAPFPMEVIQRDHDITIFFEAWGQYRKIYIEGYDRPEPILPSRMGYSVGEWQGETLVVNTHMLSERTQGRSLMSENATIIERLSIEEGPNGVRRLVSDIVFSDPDIYREDIHVRGVWNDSPGTPIMEYVCTEELYEQHLERVRASQQ